MYVLILILHILVCFALMAVVLMQSGKGHGLAGAFGGGGGNQTLFGGRGAVDFLGKATWVLGAAFMVTSLTLAVLGGAMGKSSKPQSLIPKESGSAPAIPGGLPAGAPGGGEATPVPSEPPASAPAPSGGGK